jgi:hypothetical protein
MLFLSTPEKGDAILFLPLSIYTRVLVKVESRVEEMLVMDRVAAHPTVRSGRHGFPSDAAVG